MWLQQAGSEYLAPLLEIPGILECHSQPRQSLPTPYWQNGYVDIVKPTTILEKNSMAGNKVLPFLVNETLF